MLTDGFGPRMRANMEIALERACKFLPGGTEGHEARRYVASKILECSERGNGSVRALTAAGRAAAIELHAPDKPASDSREGPKQRPQLWDGLRPNGLSSFRCRVLISTPG
jgi:hypothetical protein